jgi:hypothetical protein
MKDDKVKATEDWRQKYLDEAKAHAATRQDYAREREAETIDELVKAALSQAGMNPSAIPKALKLYDRGMVSMEKSGKGMSPYVQNMDDVLRYFRGEWGDFFMEMRTQGTSPPTPPVTQNVYGCSLQEHMSLANKNPERVNDILAHIDANTTKRR